MRSSYANPTDKSDQFAASLGANWNYKGPNGPEYWASLDPYFVICDKGQHQSPIDIVKTFRPHLTPIVFKYQPSLLNAVHTGNTVRINYERGSYIIAGERKYDLVYFDVHLPGEHAHKGYRPDMSVQLVHQDMEGNYAIIEVPMVTGVANRWFTQLWKHVPKQAGNEKLVDTYLYNVIDILPKDREYFTYNGSLSHPPCTENASWFIMKKPVQISDDQLRQFSKVIPHSARPLQKLNKRVIKEL